MASNTYSIPVTLTSVKDKFDQRHLLITQGSPCTIGRASQSTLKDLRAGPTNALFDCPVVSRKHAELLANPYAPACDQITIVDRESMHGTKVNNHTLRPHAPFPLRSGDRIQLGSKITRGADTHEGVIVTFERSAPESQNSHTFAGPSTYNGHFEVPNVSDDESDRRSEVSSDDGESVACDYYGKRHHSSAKTTPEQMKAKPGSSQDPIDVEKIAPPTRPAVINLTDDEDNFSARPQPGMYSMYVAPLPATTAAPRHSNPSSTRFVQDTLDKNSPDVLVQDSVPNAATHHVVHLTGDDDGASVRYPDDESISDKDSDSQSSEVDYPGFVQDDEAMSDLDRLSPSDADDLDVYPDDADAMSEDEDDELEVFEKMKNSYSNKEPSPELESPPVPSQKVSAPASAPPKQSNIDDFMTPSASKTDTQPRYDPVRGTIPGYTGFEPKSASQPSNSFSNYYAPSTFTSGNKSGAPAAFSQANGSRWDVPPPPPPAVQSQSRYQPRDFVDHGAPVDFFNQPFGAYNAYDRFYAPEAALAYTPPAIDGSQPYGFGHEWSNTPKYQFGANLFPTAAVFDQQIPKASANMPPTIPGSATWKNQNESSAVKDRVAINNLLYEKPTAKKTVSTVDGDKADQTMTTKNVFDATPAKNTKEPAPIPTSATDTSKKKLLTGPKRKADDISKNSREESIDAVFGTNQTESPPTAMEIMNSVYSANKYYRAQTDAEPPIERMEDLYPTRSVRRKANDGTPIATSVAKYGAAALAGSLAGGAGVMAFLVSPLSEKFLEWMA